LKAKIEKAILQQKNLETLSKQVEITITGEGLRMELIEGKGGTFYDSGSPQLNENGTELLRLIAAQLKGLPNKVTIEGHTDAQPYSGANGYTNWELSADRANAARRVLQEDGLDASRVSEVRGFADQMPRAGADPMDPSNRRIALVVKWVEVPSGADGGTKATAETGNAGGDKTAAVPSGTSAAPAAPAKPVVVAAKPGS
jgi:chemotaxis protein MotB